MIRQAISCDICGTEMLNSNHWFVANTNGSELRIRSWNSRNRLRAGMQHLCGQTCLHKLVDEFMAGYLHERVTASTNSAASQPVCKAPITGMVSAHARSKRSLIASPAAEFESARTMTPPEPIVHNPRAEAWKRELARQHVADPESRRRSIA